MAESNLTPEEKATNYETMLHIQRVRNLINLIIKDFIWRAEEHDQSKMGKIELETFVEYTPKLKSSTYGSDEYKGFLQAMAPALKNHYENNRHHPEHFPNGLDDMTLMDLLEMFIDWKAASERHEDGNIYKSIEINKQRFGMSDQLCKIFNNTVKYIWPQLNQE